jgi:hypothetical protein
VEKRNKKRGKNELKNEKKSKFVSVEKDIQYMYEKKG